MLFINTRPAERAISLQQLTSSELSHAPNKLQIISLPLLELVPTKLTDIERHNLDKLKTGYYQRLIVISPTAGQLGCQYLSQHSLQLTTDVTHIVNVDQIVSVGKATATTLMKYNLPSILPAVSSNEGMLEMDCLSGLDHRHSVMLWRGQGGRDLLINTLRQRGVTVDVVEWYQRQLPIQALPTYQQYLPIFTALNNRHNSAIAHVLISSRQIFLHWQTLVDSARQQSTSQAPTLKAPTLTDFHYLALGQRLATQLDKQHLSYQQLDNLQPKTIQQALLSADFT